MGYMFRHNPAFKFCFQAAQNGWLGDVFEIHGVISKAIGAEQDPKTYALAVKRLSKGYTPRFQMPALPKPKQGALL